MATESSMHEGENANEPTCHAQKQQLNDDSSQPRRGNPLQRLVHRTAAVIASAVRSFANDVSSPIAVISRRWRTESFHKRIESQLHLLRQAQLDAEAGKSSEASLTRASSLLSYGEMGVALFSPLDAAFETDLDEAGVVVERCDAPVEEEGGEGDDGDEGGFFIDDDEGEEDPRRHIRSSSEPTPSSSAVTAAESSVAHVHVRPESADVLRSSPFILSLPLMEQIAEHGLPPTVKIKPWVRLFSVARDGDAFGTFLSKVRGHSHTLLVARTTEGETLGGFADATWERQQSGHDGSAFFGTGKSFLFQVVEGARFDDDSSGDFAGDKGVDGSSEASQQPSRRPKNRKTSSYIPAYGDKLGESPTSVADLAAPTRPPHQASSPTGTERVVVHRWQGKNNYNQLCHTGDGRIAMGGGGDNGSFGICIQDYFGRGSTGPCETYGTFGPLSSREHFEIAGFEVFGFCYQW